MASKEEIISYVMNSPQNTNPNVLKSMMGNMSGGESNTIQLKTIFNGELTPDNNSYVYITLDEADYFDVLENHIYVFQIKESTNDPIYTGFSTISYYAEGQYGDPNYYAFSSDTLYIRIQLQNSTNIINSLKIQCPSVAGTTTFNISMVDIELANN